MKNTKRVMLLALMVSQALVLSIVESLIPNPIPVPGVKLGLANIVTLLVLVFFSLKETLMVVVIRCIILSFYSGGLTVFMFSVTGGVLSVLVMTLFYKKFSGLFGITGISVAGAVSHNIGQLLVAAAILKDFSVMAYLPVLLASGVVMGCFVGLCSGFLIKAIEKARILF